MASPPHDMPMDDEFEHVSHSLGKDEGANEHEYFDFVDMNEFQFLVTHTAALEEQVKGMNANLTQVTTLLQELVHNQNLPTSSVPKPMEGSTNLPQLAEDPLKETLPSSLSSHDTMNLLKSTKLPTYHGEEREHTKAMVNTFLHKWISLHSLRHNQDPICIVEMILSLEGKA